MAGRLCQTSAGATRLCNPAPLAMARRYRAAPAGNLCGFSGRPRSGRRFRELLPAPARSRTRGPGSRRAAMVWSRCQRARAHLLCYLAPHFAGGFRSDGAFSHEARRAATAKSDPSLARLSARESSYNEETRVGSRGEVCERLKQAVLKTAIPERVSGVRIPPSPPDCRLSHFLSVSARGRTFMCSNLKAFALLAILVYGVAAVAA